MPKGRIRGAVILDGTLSLNNADETRKKIIAPPLIMHHAGDCSSSPTLHAELPLYAEGGLLISGMDWLAAWERDAMVHQILNRAGYQAVKKSKEKTKRSDLTEIPLECPDVPDAYQPRAAAEQAQKAGWPSLGGSAGPHRGAGRRLL